ncbi:MAG TPA: DUF1559 domain-containing protein [Armatimonadota bacterium]|nr:DUF1559 domain-containing protein [Armatimonadota bacterium]
MKRTAFTLIELLVVIAIIAILAAILFPVFAKAREKARQTQCVNNQKQMATAVQMWSQEHEEKFPAAATFWTDIDVPAKVKQCPTAGKTVANAYVYSNFLAGKALGDIADPTHEMLVADGQHTASTAQPYDNIAYTKADLAMRHQNNIVVAFADGHAELRTTAPWKYAAAYWFTAESLPMSENSYVTAWSDNTRKGPDATLSTSATADWQKPTYVSNAISGRPAVRFAWGQYLQFSESSPKNLYAVIVAGQRISANTEWLNTYRTRLAGQNATELQFEGTDYANKVRFHAWSTGSQGEWDSPSSVGIAAGDTFVVAGCFPTDRAKLSVYVNGKRYDSSTFDATKYIPRKTFDSMAIGAGFGSNYLSGYIGDVVVFSDKISDVEFLEVQKELMSKYGI